MGAELIAIECGTKEASRGDCVSLRTDRWAVATEVKPHEDAGQPAVLALQLPLRPVISAVVAASRRPVQGLALEGGAQNSGFAAGFTVDHG